MPFGAVQEKKEVSQKKRPVEIECSKCSTRFRLWVPPDTYLQWEKGASINCVSCGAAILIRTSDEGVEIRAARAPHRQAPSEEPREAAPAQHVPQPPPAAQAAPAAPAAEETHAAAEENTGEAVLFIEDERLAREMAEFALKDAGVRLIMAKNAKEALKHISSEKIDLIVTDLHLKNANDPDSQLDGEDLLKQIADSGKNIPAIVTTGKDIIDDIVLDPKWFDLHVKGFIQKGNPFWAEELKTKMKEVLFKD